MIHFDSSKILIPVDFSETSLLAIKHGVFTGQLNKSEVHLLHVIDIHYVAQNLFLPLVEINQDAVETKAQMKLEAFAEEVLHEYGVSCNCIVRTGTPSFEILQVAEEMGISLIVMGTHGYSPLQEALIGSVTLKVLSKSPCPIMAMNSLADHKGYHTIVLPIDTSAHTRQKVNYAMEFAKQFSASVHAIGLLGSDELEEKNSVELILSQIGKIADKHKVIYHSKVLMDVKNRATSSVNYINEVGADLIIIMTDQDAEISGLFLGPYSQQIIHTSKVPVIAIRPQDLSANDGSILSGTSGF